MYSTFFTTSGVGTIDFVLFHLIVSRCYANKVLTLSTSVCLLISIAGKALQAHCHFICTQRTYTHAAQVIAMVCHLVERKENGPYLIVAPASVLPNWRAELTRWAPSLSVVDYRGSGDVRADIWARQVAGGVHIGFEMESTSARTVLLSNDPSTMCL